MKIALLLRGFHYLEKDRFGYPLDGRRWLKSLDSQILRPLKGQHDVTIFLVTYPSPIQDQMVQQLRPTVMEILDSRTSNQIGTYLSGLRLITSQQQKFDRIIATRFDLKYLIPATAWNVWERRGIFLPWKEYEISWNDHHKVGDAIHVVDTTHVNLFEAGLEELWRAGSKEMHRLYDGLRPKTTDLHFMAEGFYDSNTMYWNRECRNPIYRIANRPRLPLFVPYRPSLQKDGYGIVPLLRHRKRQLHYKVATVLISLTSAMSRFKQRLFSTALQKI